MSKEKGEGYKKYLKFADKKVHTFILRAEGGEGQKCIIFVDVKCEDPLQHQVAYHKFIAKMI